MTMATAYPFSQSSPVALVTGAASLLGEAVCKKLASEGMRIILHYGKSNKKAKDHQEKLKSLGVQTHLLQADLSIPRQVGLLTQRAVDRWGRLDLLINNASLFIPTPESSKNWAGWERAWKINTIAPYTLALAAKPHLQKTNGNIVNITDIYGEIPNLKNYPAYSATKAALLFLTRFLALELSPKIRVNAVSPGAITFPKSYSPFKRRKILNRSALKRQGTPEEIADSVWFLASNRFVTGQVIRVDGGRIISTSL